MSQALPLPAELFWLIATVALTSVQWMPYVVNRILVRGLRVSLGTPTPADKPLSPWADRAYRAHTNSVENLVLFAPVVLVIQMTGVATPTTATACMVFFWSR